MFEYGNRTSSPLEPRLPELLQPKLNMPPPTPRQPSGWARQQPGHHGAQAGRRVPLAPTTTVPMRIPTISAASMMAQQGGSNMRRARRGIQITISASKRSTAGPAPANAANNNTAAMAPPPRRHQHQHQHQHRSGHSSNSSNNASPVSIYGGGGARAGDYHSFTVCTSEDCDLCNHTGDLDDDGAHGDSSASRRQGSFFLHANNSLPNTGEGDLGRSGGKEDGSLKAHRRRRLIPQTCEHCRMQFIPVKKGDPASASAPASPSEAAATSAAGDGDEAASRCGSIVSSCSSGSSDGGSVGGGSGSGSSSGPVVLEGSLAGGSSLGSAASSLAAKHAGSNSGSNSAKKGPFSPLSQLISNRTASPSPASVDTTSGRPNSSNSSRSSAYTNNSGYGRSSASSRSRFDAGGDDGGDGSLPQESGFCSGDCKMSYMLSNPAAVRRRRAAAAARAAMRAAQIEDSIERSRRAAAAATAAAAEERRKVSAAASKAQRAGAAAAAAASASNGEQGCPTTSN